MTASTTAGNAYTSVAGQLDARRAGLGAYLEALNARTDLAPYFTADATLTIMGGPPAAGRDAVVAMIRGIHYQSFDSHVRVDRRFHGDAHATAELVFLGTHVADFAGVAATGRSVEVPYCVVYDLTDDGRISAMRAYFPMHVLMAQLTS